MANYLDEEGLRRYNELLQMKFMTNGGTTLEAGENIEIVDNKISVQTAPNVEKDNTKPITSAAVYTEVGNINVLLQTI